MSNRLAPGKALGIGVVERESGLSKDTLRIWERRYGFPQPVRDPNGERVYPPKQVEKLLLMKRLMDLGQRPGKMADLTIGDLREKLHAPDAVVAVPPEFAEPLRLLAQHETQLLRQYLQYRLARQGLRDFVMHTVAPLTVTVGEAWSRGRLAIHEEHIYTELVTTILRQSFTVTATQGSAPRILLTTLPGEQHAIGLLMAEALMRIEGATCIALGTQTPLPEIAHAAIAHDADIVALSFSAAFSSRRATQSLEALRKLLANNIELWSGGSAVGRFNVSAPGIVLLISLQDMLDRLESWRALKVSRKPSMRRGAKA